MPARIPVEVGQQVGTYTILSREPSKLGASIWRVKCSCGRERELRGTDVGRTTCPCTRATDLTRSAPPSDVAQLRDELAQLRGEYEDLRALFVDLVTDLCYAAALKPLADRLDRAAYAEATYPAFQRPPRGDTFRF